MTTFLLDKITCQLNAKEMSDLPGITADTIDGQEFDQFLQQAQSIARPKGLGRVVHPRACGTDQVIIDHVTLSSRVLRVNITNVHRAFVCVVTCGTELANWASALTAATHKTWAVAVQMQVLRIARQKMYRYLDAHFEPGLTGGMNPGSLADWPITQQSLVFSLLGDVESQIGVKLLPNHHMFPAYSISEIRFPVAEPFYSCQLCPVDPCFLRQAPYEPNLYQTKYGVSHPHA